MICSVGTRPICQQKNASGAATSPRPLCWLNTSSMPVDTRPTGTSQECVSLILPVGAAISSLVPPAVCSPLEKVEGFPMMRVSSSYNIWGFDPDPIACFLAEMQLQTVINTVGTGFITSASGYHPRGDYDTHLGW